MMFRRYQQGIVIQDTTSGCAVTFPAQPMVVEDNSRNSVSHLYKLTRPEGSYAAAIIGPKKEKGVGPTAHNTLKELKELFVPLKYVDSSHPIAFGSCPGYEFEGKLPEGSQQKGRVVQALGTIILLVFLGDKADFPPECDAFLDSLTFLVDGALPTGRSDATHISSDSDLDSKNGGFFTTPRLDIDRSKSHKYDIAFELSRGDTLWNGVVRLPPANKRNEALADKQLEQVRDELIKVIGLKKTRERRFRMGPAEGIEWESIAKVGGVRGRVFVLGDALYAYVYASKSFEKDKADEFLNSVHFVFGKPLP